MFGFENYTKTVDSITITSLKSKRLVRINPQKDGFFDAVINFKLTKKCNEFYYEEDKKDLKEFIEAISEVKAAKLEPFYKPIYDPSEVCNTIGFKKNKEPAVGHSYWWWTKVASLMPAVEGKHWHLATEYQYYAFLVWLINQLLKDGKSVEEALYDVVIDSTELGLYRYTKDEVEIQPTGSRGVRGVYDLANVYKILACSNEETEGFLIAGGSYFNYGVCFPLATLQSCMDEFCKHNDCVGLLVL